MLANRLDSLAPAGVRVLHDRRIPRSKANIDIAIGPGGVFVIDAKRYQGRRPTLRVEGGLLRPRTERLFVGSRDCSKLVAGVQRQVDLVRQVLLADASLQPSAVRGVLCFVAADWPLIGGSFVIDDVDIVWPKKLANRLVEPGSLTDNDVRSLHRRLAAAFPVA